MNFDRANRLDHSADPVAAFLRKYVMKIPFIRQLELQLESDPDCEQGVYPDQPGSKLVIYGSSMMGKFLEDGIKMPFIGLKVSDLDLGAVLPNVQFGDEKRFKENISPKLHAAICAEDFMYAKPKSGVGNNVTPDDFEMVKPVHISPYAFTGDFYVCRDFTPDEIRRHIAAHKNLPEAQDLEHYIGNSPLRVYMVISAHPDQFPILMEPVESHIDGCGQIFWHDYRDMIAGKLARTFSDPKATDLIDLYNLTVATDADNKRFLILDGKDSIAPNLRLLLLVFSCINATSIQSGFINKDLTRAIPPTEKNLLWFKEEVEPQLALQRRQQLLDQAPDILNGVNQLLETIFPPLPGKDQKNTLWSRLHQDERQFVCKFFGRDYQPQNDPFIQTSGWRKHFSRFFIKQDNPISDNDECPLRKVNSGRQFEMDLTLIQERYEGTFQKHPKLQGNIGAAEIVERKLSEMNYGKSDSSIAMDF